MGKQQSSSSKSNNNSNNKGKPKPKASSNLTVYGKGHVTPVQIAFIVDRYLSDNNYSHTRSSFRTEASHLIAKSNVQEAPKSLMSLAAILDEYISLKEQKVMLDQEKCHLEHEKFRVQNLLRTMQDAMNTFNGGGIAIATSSPPPPPSLMSSLTTNSTVIVPQMDVPMGSSAGFPIYSPPLIMPALRPPITQMDQSNFSTPVTSNPATKRRKSTKDACDAPVNAKRPRCSSKKTQLSVTGKNDLPQSGTPVNNQEKALQSSAGQSSPNDNLQKEKPVQGSSIAKCLFNKTTPSPPTNMSVPKTPSQQSSSHSDKSVSPLQTSSNATSGDNITLQPKTSTNRIVISSETVRVSPAKKLTYYSVERNHCISSSSPAKSTMKRLSTRDHVKGRLDFDGSDSLPSLGNWVSNSTSTPELDKEGEVFDLDLPNLDVLGADFSLSELLVDFDLYGNFSGQTAVDSSPGSHSGSAHETWNSESEGNQVLTELSSTVTEIFSEKDMHTQGQQAVTSVKSTTKSIKIISPVKNTRRICSDQENKDVAN